MKTNRILIALIGCCFAAPFVADGRTARPRITGIAYVKLFVSDSSKSADFYSMVVRSSVDASLVNQPCDWCERIPSSIAIDKGFGPIKIEPLGSTQSANLVKEIGFVTENAAKLREFLLGEHVSAGKLTKCDGGPCFSILDPEQHRLVFVEHGSSVHPPQGMPGAYTPLELPAIRIIHAGFIVKDRAVEDHFYKDVLGFRPYWHGGMKDDRDDWVALQVPDGTDWLEYMLNISPTADKHTLGVMNHIAIGVTDIQATKAQLVKNGWKPTEEPKIGRDGKWQLNVYDPDDTRIEFMEFTPKEKPCCSEFSAPHPKP